MTSAFCGESVPKLIGVFDEFREVMAASGALGGRREQQAERLVWEHARAEVVERMGGAPAVNARVAELAAAAAEGRLSASQAGAIVAEEVGKMRGWDE